MENPAIAGVSGQGTEDVDIAGVSGQGTEDVDMPGVSGQDPGKPENAGSTQKLRSGFTTGACAAAAAGAAAEYLFTGRLPGRWKLRLPGGKAARSELDLEVAGAVLRDGTASCCIRKDSGDDPDVTDGILVWADVRRGSRPGVSIDGGEGVGRVTKPGLDQPVGAAAINSVPRRMIREQVEAAAGRCGEDLSRLGAEVVVRIPDGVHLAERTFNPKLGIVGGISVLGTTGIVEPMSEPAIRATIRAELSVRRAEGFTAVAAAPGNYGTEFLGQRYGLPPELVVQSSNYIRDTLRMAGQAGFRKLLLAGHAGKLVKVAGGVPNTHSRYGDRRMEILSDLGRTAARRGGGEVKLPDISGCISTDEALRLYGEAGLAEAVMREAVARIRRVCLGWVTENMEVEVCMFAGHGIRPAMTDGAEDLIWCILSERDRVRKT